MRRFSFVAFILATRAFFMEAQSVNDLFSQIHCNDVPVVSYQVGDIVYSSLSQDSPVRMTFESVPYEHGMKGLVTFENGFAALTRRTRGSLAGGRISRFETYLGPSGKVSYTIWADEYEGEWQNALKLIFQERFLYG